MNYFIALQLSILKTSRFKTVLGLVDYLMTGRLEKAQINWGTFCNIIINETVNLEKKGFWTQYLWIFFLNTLEGNF